MNKLKDKVAIVTGAGSGIGRGIALALSREGASAVAVGRRLEKVQETADMIAKENGRAMALSIDVSQAADVARMVEVSTSEFGGIDILVNNAGVHVPGGILRTSEEQWDWLMSINLKGVFLCSKLAAPIMMKKGWGRIINISSCGALTPSPNAAYCASKGGINVLTKSMALELSPSGVTVNAICPGAHTTEMTASAMNAPAVRSELMKKQIVGRYGTPGDIGAAAVYLASDDAGYVTGSILAIDGGWTISEGIDRNW